MVIPQIGRKKLWGHRAYLGDIMQNIAKIGRLLLIFRGKPGSI